MTSAYGNIFKFFRPSALYFRIVYTVLFLPWIEFSVTEHLSVYLPHPALCPTTTIYIKTTGNSRKGDGRSQNSMSPRKMISHCLSTQGPSTWVLLSWASPKDKCIWRWKIIIWKKFKTLMKRNTKNKRKDPIISLSKKSNSSKFIHFFQSYWQVLKYHSIHIQRNSLWF